MGLPDLDLADRCAISCPDDPMLPDRRIDTVMIQMRLAVDQPALDPTGQLPTVIPCADRIPCEPPRCARQWIAEHHRRPAFARVSHRNTVSPETLRLNFVLPLALLLDAYMLVCAILQRARRSGARHRQSWEHGRAAAGGLHVGFCVFPQQRQGDHMLHVAKFAHRSSRSCICSRTHLRARTKAGQLPHGGEGLRPFVIIRLRFPSVYQRLLFARRRACRGGSADEQRFA